MDKRKKQKDKIKRTLKLENVIFEKLHVISILCILLLVLFIAIEYYLNYKSNPNNNNWLDDIEIVEEPDTDTTISNTYDNQEVLLNPGKGWILYSSKESDKYNYIISTGYTRIDWCDVEPQEGEYNWDIIDKKIDNYKKKGKKYAFGILCASSSSTSEYVTPKWVFDAGAEYYTYYNTSYDIEQKIPVWTDEIFLEKLNNFIKALAERYDGNENIAFIDIRSYGNYGEQHLGTIGGSYISSDELQELYLKPYREAFKKTLLVSPCGESRYNKAYTWAIENGITLRRDGIFKYSDGSECLMAYGKLPTIFEYTSDYNWMLNNYYWSQESLLQYVENGKPSYLQFDPAMYKENKAFCEMLANKIGYYFKFKGATYTNKVTTLEESNIKLNFINEGVAPLYEDCTVYIGLLDSNYNLVKKYKTDIDPHKWMPNEEIQENLNIKLDGVESGKYIISLGLFLNENDEKPTYLLGSSGGTDDKWYVFGEIEITNPPEEYNITVDNENYLINSYNGYKININATNLRDYANYKFKLYVNDNLVNETEIDNSELVYNNSLDVIFENGMNSYRIEIEKNDEIVYEINKVIYVCNFTEDYKEISNLATEKYSEFKTKFSKEISQIQNLSTKLTQMEKYLISVGQTSTKLLESASIDAMKMHYELGNLILQSYNSGELKTDDEKVSSMLDMLEEIGNLYENLVTISAQDLSNVDIDQTNTIIQETENIINEHKDEVEIKYPTKLLDLSKDYFNKALYINSLEEENTIKAGLIISNNLHSKLLANWSNTFIKVQMEKYIDYYIASNPVTIKYSNTEFTNENVTATLETNAEIQVTNNSNSKEYTFKENGSFTFEYTIKGRQFKITATVDNIDKENPTITGIKNGKVYTHSVTPIITDKNLQKIELTFNGQVVKGYQSNIQLIDEGYYVITATDKAGNSTRVGFQILINQNKDYQIEGNIIKNITNSTTRAEFEKQLGFITKFTITRNGKEISQDSIIATGDVLTTEAGDSYTLIVTGDVNRDGMVTIHDIIKIRIYLVLKNNLDEIELIAADSNLDGEPISISDLIRVRILVLMGESTN